MGMKQCAAGPTAAINGMDSSAKGTHTHPSSAWALCVIDGILPIFCNVDPLVISSEVIFSRSKAVGFHRTQLQVCASCPMQPQQLDKYIFLLYLLLA